VDGKSSGIILGCYSLFFIYKVLPLTIIATTFFLSACKPSLVGIFGIAIVMYVFYSQHADFWINSYKQIGVAALIISLVIYSIDFSLYYDANENGVNEYKSFMAQAAYATSTSINEDSKWYNTVWYLAAIISLCFALKYLIRCDSLFVQTM